LRGVNCKVTASFSKAGDFDRVDPTLDRVEYAALEDLAPSRIVELIEAEAQASAMGKGLVERTYIGEARTIEFATALLSLLPTPEWHPDWPTPGTATPDAKWHQPFFQTAGDPGESSQATVWMSAGDTVAPPHRDQWFNVSCTLEGTKTFFLVPPEYHTEVEDSPRPCARLERHAPGEFTAVALTDKTTGAEVHTSGHSPLNFRPLWDKNDHTAFPIDAVTLEAGDVLYLPPDWYHQVESTADPVTHRSVAVNFWSARLFAWAVHDNPDRASRLADIWSRHPSPPPTSPPWEAFMD
jgi:hypothetical protein